MVILDCEEHPLFVAHAVRCVFPEPLGQVERHADLEAGLAAAVASADCLFIDWRPAAAAEAGAAVLSRLVAGAESTQDAVDLIAKA